MTEHRMTEDGAAGPSRPIDLRLAVAALAGWAALIWGLGRSTRAVVLAVAALLAVLALLLVLGRRWRRSDPLVFALASMVVLLAPLAVRLHQAKDGPLAQLARRGAEVTAEVRVSSIRARWPRTARPGRRAAPSRPGCARSWWPAARFRYPARC